jgi:hypothetical protein
MITLFIRLIIRHFQLIFSVRTVFFSHNKSVNSVFQPAYQHSRMAPMPLRSKRRDEVSTVQRVVCQSQPFNVQTNKPGSITGALILLRGPDQPPPGKALW